MKNIRLFAIVSALAACATLPSAPARAVDLTAIGGVTISNYSFDPSFGTSAGVSFGVGALVGHGFMPGFGIETGAIFSSRKISATVLTVQTDTTITALEIPVLLRVTALPIVFIEAGPYAGIGLSSNSSAGALTISNSAPKLDIGLRGVLGASFPILPKLSLRAQGQYSLGLTNISNSSTVSQYSRNIDILGGVSIEL